MQVLRVLLGQRGTLLRSALAAVLSQQPDLEVVAELASREDVLPAAQRQNPHVAVLDFALPGTMPIDDLCWRLDRIRPACRVLLLADQEACARLAVLAKLAPRVGLIATESSPAHLVDSVRRLARGDAVLDAELAVAALHGNGNPLTQREREVLQLAVDGAPAKEIARRLSLNVGTVRNYLSRSLSKTGARTRIEAIRIAQEAGWI